MLQWFFSFLCDQFQLFWRREDEVCDGQSSKFDKYKIYKEYIWNE